MECLVSKRKVFRPTSNARLDCFRFHDASLLLCSVRAAQVPPSSVISVLVCENYRARCLIRTSASCSISILVPLQTWPFRPPSATPRLNRQSGSGASRRRRRRQEDDKELQATTATTSLFLHPSCFDLHFVIPHTCRTRSNGRRSNDRQGSLREALVQAHLRVEGA